MITEAEDDPERIAAVAALVWRRPSRKDAHHRGLREAAAADRPWAWALFQAAEHAHPVHAVREEARAQNARWAESRGLEPHVWADRVAAAWPPDPAHPERFARVQARRLEAALRDQIVWPAAALAAIVRDREALAPAIRGLVWLDESDAPRWLDDAGRTRDFEDREVDAHVLRIAHPTHPALRALDRARVRDRIDPSHAPFPQLERETFGPDDLVCDAHGWHRPRWSAPLPLYRLLHDLRRGGWRYTAAEDNGTIAGFYWIDRRADQTALWRIMDKEDRPNYGVLVYEGFHPPDLPLRVGLHILRGAWDRKRLNWSGPWPPNLRSYGIQPTDLIPPGDADPLFLSEVLRDVWRASRVTAQ